MDYGPRYRINHVCQGLLLKLRKQAFPWSASAQQFFLACLEDLVWGIDVFLCGLSGRACPIFLLSPPLPPRMHPTGVMRQHVSKKVFLEGFYCGN